MQHLMRAKKQSLLWKIWSKDKDQPDAYLMGTMHVKSPVAFRRIEQLKYLIESCDAFAAELPIDEVNLHPEFARIFLANPTNHLKGNLSNQRYQKVRAQVLRAVHIDLEPLQHLRPMILSNLIDEAMMPIGNAAHALDETLWRYAQNLGKPTFGLETVQHQIAVLQAVDPQQEIRAFLGAVKNISQHRAQIKKMMHWYETEQIHRLYQASYKSLGNWRQLLLKNRNQVMVEQLVHHLSQQRVFAAVGAAHLTGKYGLLRGLKKQGFKIKPVPA